MSDIQGADPRLKDWVIAPTQALREVQQATEGWNQGDVERWIADFAQDCEWYPTTEGGLLGESTPICGHEGLRAFAREAHELWEEYRIEGTDLLLRGRVSLLVGRFRARGRLSGIEFDTPMFWVSERNDAGKRVWAKSFVDLDDALAAAGERNAIRGVRN